MRLVLSLNEPLSKAIGILSSEVVTTSVSVQLLALLIIIFIVGFVFAIPRGNFLPIEPYEDSRSSDATE